MGADRGRGENMAMMNRKAVFYTVVGVIMVFTLLLLFIVYEKEPSIDKTSVILTRVKTTNNFLENINRDLERALQISSMRASLSLLEHITTTGDFVDDSKARYEEAIVDGTVNGNQMILMENTTFVDWINKIESEANRIGVMTNITLIVVSVYQEDPWHVKSTANITMRVRDSKDTAEWTQTKQMQTKIPIVGLEDPLYLVNTYGRVANIINVTPYEGDYVQGSNVANLTIHLNSSLYTNSTLAPSFLMRLENDLGSSPFGIESMVNLNKLEEQGITTKNRSNIDYIYFGFGSTTNYKVTGLPTWFHIDDGHVNRYQVQNLTY